MWVPRVTAPDAGWPSAVGRSPKYRHRTTQVPATVPPKILPKQEHGRGWFYRAFLGHRPQ